MNAPAPIVMVERNAASLAGERRCDVLRTSIVVLAIAAPFLLTKAAADAQEPSVAGATIERALRYLENAVRQWPREKGCYSCHNNGDAARALYIAQQRGFTLDATALEGTTAWLTAPQKWHEGREDEPFKDQRLSAIQFAAALVEADRAGMLRDRDALFAAARLVAAEQGDDGAWHVDRSGIGGSPITYGDELATALCRRTILAFDPARYAENIAAADAYLRTSTSRRVVDVAGVVLGLDGAGDSVAQAQRERCVQLLLAAQARSGGWGLFANHQTEPFDTAIAIIALATLENRADVAEAIRRGRAYLVAAQADDGSWDETTRPGGTESYAHRVSTTAWAMIALVTGASSE